LETFSLADMLDEYWTVTTRKRKNYLLPQRGLRIRNSISTYDGVCINIPNDPLLASFQASLGLISKILDIGHKGADRLVNSRQQLSIS
jgi:hypothetical protein